MAFTNCEFCPLRQLKDNNEQECFVHLNGAYHYCNKLNPEHKDYNPKYLTSIQRRNNLLPSIMTTLKAAGTAIVKNALNSFSGVPEEVKEERLAICNGCPKLLAGNRRCSVCSCFVDYKVQLAAESCPEAKWLAQPPKTTQFNAADCGCQKG